MTRKIATQTLSDSLPSEIDAAGSTLSDLKTNWVDRLIGNESNPTEAWELLRQIYNSQDKFLTINDEDDFILLCDKIDIINLYRIYAYSVGHLASTAEVNHEQYIPHVHGLLSNIDHINRVIHSYSPMANSDSQIMFELERSHYARTLYALAVNHAASFFSKITPENTRDGYLHIDDQFGIPFEQLLFYLEIRQQIITGGRYFQSDIDEENLERINLERIDIEEEGTNLTMFHYE